MSSTSAVKSKSLLNASTYGKEKGPNFTDSLLPRIRVVCFHGAGCDGTVWLTKGTKSAPLPNPLIDFCRENQIELLAFQMGGRQGTMDPSLIASDIIGEAESALEELRSRLVRDTPMRQVKDIPLVLLGHSLGCFVAYEFACLLRSENIALPQRLFLAASVAPDLPKDKRPWRRVDTLDKEQLQHELREWGARNELFNEDVWLAYEKIIRRDFALLDNYTFTEPVVTESGFLISPTSLSALSSQRSVTEPIDKGRDVDDDLKMSTTKPNNKNTSSPSSLVTSASTASTGGVLAATGAAAAVFPPPTSAAAPAVMTSPKSAGGTNKTSASDNKMGSTGFGLPPPALQRPKQSFHAPLGIRTTAIYTDNDKKITKDHVEGWRRIIMGSNLFSSSPSGFGTAAKNSEEFLVTKVEGSHNFLYEPTGRKQMMDLVIKALDDMLIDDEYGC